MNMDTLESIIEDRVKAARKRVRGCVGTLEYWEKIKGQWERGELPVPNHPCAEGLPTFSLDGVRNMIEKYLVDKREADKELAHWEAEILRIVPRVTTDMASPLDAYVSMRRHQAELDERRTRDCLNYWVRVDEGLHVPGPKETSPDGVWMPSVAPEEYKAHVGNAYSADACAGAVVDYWEREAGRLMSVEEYEAARRRWARILER